MLDGNASYVVCWRHDGRLRFLRESDWAAARELFERRLRQAGDDPRRHRAAYGALAERGQGISCDTLGLYQAIAVRNADGSDPDLFLRIWGQRFLPVVGSKKELVDLADRVSQSGVRCERYAVIDAEELAAEAATPPSEADPSPRAKRALKELLAGGRRRELPDGLSAGELIYVAEGLRRERRSSLALPIAERLLRSKVTAGRLNLKGGVFRDLGLLDTSAELYRDSMAQCDSAEVNPYAYIGLAATLRRLGRSDEAYDHLKLPLRYYPNDRYALETRDAIYRDFRRPKTRLRRSAGRSLSAA